MPSAASPPSARPQSVTDLSEEQAAGVAHLKSGLVDKVNLWMLSEPTWRLLKEW